MTKNETPIMPIPTVTPTTNTPIATDVTPSTGQPGTVSPAPVQLYIKAGQFEQFTY